MNPVMNTVGIFYSAMAQRDSKKLRSVLSDDFSFQGPLMKFDDPDTFTEKMVAFPFEATASDSHFIVDGNNVAHTFRWKMTVPAKAEIPMCEILTVTNGKVQRSELFFDTKLFPVY